MFTIADIRNEYKRLDAIVGENISELPIEISHNDSRKAGCYCSTVSCGSVYGEKFIISDFSLNATENNFYDTIRHEYAHALATRREGRRCGHSAVWRKYAVMVGANPRATYVADEKEVEHRINQLSKKGKGYTVTCEKCNHVFVYQRMGKIVKALLNGSGNDGKYTCPVCGGHTFKAEKI